MQYIEGLINIATFSLLVRGLSLVAVWLPVGCHVACQQLYNSSIYYTVNQYE